MDTDCVFQAAHGICRSKSAATNHAGLSANKSVKKSFNKNIGGGGEGGIGSPTNSRHGDALTDVIWDPGNPINFINVVLVRCEHQNTHTAGNVSFYSVQL